VYVVENVITILDAASTSWRRSILYFLLAATSEIGGSDLVLFYSSQVSEQKEIIVGRTNRGPSLQYT